MMKFTTIEGAPLYVDPASIQVVAPAYAPPPADMPPAQQRMMVPKMVGVQLILSGFNVAVRGNIDEVALNIRATLAGVALPGSILAN